MTDARIDAYIAKAPEFAKPILTYLRRCVHAAVPDVQEQLKWRSPSFEYKGMFCGMAAFKQHCAFGFWKHKILVERGVIDQNDRAMGQYGKITSVADLPGEKKLIAIIKAAAKLNDEGTKMPRPVKAKPPLKAPAYFMAAVKRNKKALATYEGFSPSQKREYVEWVTEAKTTATRDQRLATSVDWMSQGKMRNWKYVR
jgi:hypothetical protein